VPEVLHPVEGTHAGPVHEQLQPVGRTHVGEVHGGLSPMSGTLDWSREEHEEEGAAKAMCDDHNRHSPSPCTARGEEGEKMGSEVEPGKKGGMGGRCLKIFFFFISHYPILISLVID